MRLLVFCTPRLDGISEVTARIFDLSVIAHGELGI
jgi:hypothetical protein